MTQPRLILASRSPRRIELLRDAGYTFEIEPADIDEDAVPANLSPTEVAIYLATEKARVIAKRHPSAFVLGADTVVAVGATLYGKAENANAARTMLVALAGKEQHVITGVSLFTPVSPRPDVRAVTSIVHMKPMPLEKLDAYLATDAWRGKAGAYGIQDHDPTNDPFVRIVSGGYTNVVGLPMETVRAMLLAAGIAPANNPSTR